MYINPSLKRNNIPNIEEIRKSIFLAEESEEKIRDQRPLMSILNKLPAASPRLKGLIKTRKTALTSFDWNILSENKILSAKIKQELNNIIDSIIELSVNTDLFGVFAIQIKWQLINGVYIPEILRQYLPEELEKATTGELFIVETDEKNTLTRRPLSAAQDLLFSTDSDINPGGLLRSILIHEFLRDRTLQEWWNINKRLKGFVQAKAEEGEKEAAGDALKNFLTNNFAVTGKEVEFVLNELAGAKTIESFPKFLEEIRNEVAVAILGQANTTQLPNNGGSRAALQILNSIRADILFSDMRTAKRIINQLLFYYFQLNTDRNANSCPYQFNFVLDDNSDVETALAVVKGAAEVGIPLKREEVYQKIGFTQPIDDSEIIEFKEMLL